MEVSLTGRETSVDECFTGTQKTMISASGLEVELGDRSLSAGLCVLVIDAFAVAFHLGQVLVEDFA